MLWEPTLSSASTTKPISSQPSSATICNAAKLSWPIFYRVNFDDNFLHHKVPLNMIHYGRQLKFMNSNIYFHLIIVNQFFNCVWGMRNNYLFHIKVNQYYALNGEYSLLEMNIERWILRKEASHSEYPSALLLLFYNVSYEHLSDVWRRSNKQKIKCNRCLKLFKYITAVRNEWKWIYTLALAYLKCVPIRIFAWRSLQSFIAFSLQSGTVAGHHCHRHLEKQYAKKTNYETSNST